ncbi:MAG: hypothetical protein ACYC3H_08410 [Bellilinea sp.]
MPNTPPGSPPGWTGSPGPAFRIVTRDPLSAALPSVERLMAGAFLSPGIIKIT